MRHRPPSDVRRGLIASTWEGAFAQAFILWTGGVFLVDFGRRLGADEGMLGVLASLPFLALFFSSFTWVGVLSLSDKLRPLFAEKPAPAGVEATT